MNTLQTYFSHKSTHKSGKNSFVLILVILMLAVSFIASILFGSTNISFHTFINDLINGNTHSPAFRIIYYVRLPRAIAAMLSGMALSVSGVIIQAVLNNSLAAPNIIGVNSGAGFFVLLIIGIFPSHFELLPIASILGALLATLFIYGIATKTGASRMTITLSGIAVSSILTAGMNTIKTFYPDSLYNASTFLIGGFFGISYQNISYSWIIILIGVLFTLIMAKDIDVLLLGEDTAKSLGMNIKGFRFLLLILASVLAGCAVSFSGLLGFIGLIIPHVVRRIVGTSHRIVILVSMFLGAAFVLICDLISRCLYAPFELPVGILLSLIGGPFFLYLILSKKRSVMN